MATLVQGWTTHFFAARCRFRSPRPKQTEACPLVSVAPPRRERRPPLRRGCAPARLLRAVSAAAVRGGGAVDVPVPVPPSSPTLPPPFGAVCATCAVLHRCVAWSRFSNHFPSLLLCLALHPALDPPSPDTRRALPGHGQCHCVPKALVIGCVQPYQGRHGGPRCRRRGVEGGVTCRSQLPVSGPSPLPPRGAVALPRPVLLMCLYDYRPPGGGGPPDPSSRSTWVGLSAEHPQGQPPPHRGVWCVVCVVTAAPVLVACSAEAGGGSWRPRHPAFALVAPVVRARRQTQAEAVVRASATFLPPVLVGHSAHPVLRLVSCPLPVVC